MEQFDTTLGMWGIGCDSKGAENEVIEVEEVTGDKGDQSGRV